MSVDDKAIVPVGQRKQPISSTSRRHGKSLTVSNNSLLALDHDFHTAGLVPSVVLKIDIPEEATSSFHQGELDVAVKEKYFTAQPP